MQLSVAKVAGGNRSSEPARIGWAAEIATSPESDCADPGYLRSDEFSARSRSGTFF
jgi:hypothetical protein